jgi:hypothetical protein
MKDELHLLLVNVVELEDYSIRKCLNKKIIEKLMYTSDKYISYVLEYQNCPITIVNFRTTTIVTL